MLGLSAFCAEDLTGALATVKLGTANVAAGIIADVSVINVDNNEWWTDTTPVSELDQMDARQVDVLISADMVLTIVATIDNGTLIFDAWYIPITSNGSLS